MSLFSKLLGGGNGQSQSQAAGGPTMTTTGAASGQTTVTIGAGGQPTYTHQTYQQLQQAMAALGMQGLSKEEKEELDELEKLHAAELKAAKLKEFKSFPNDFRQFIINTLMWKECTSRINAVHVEKSPRLKELSDKFKFGQYYGGYSAGGAGVSGSSSPWGSLSGWEQYIGMINGLTAEDLKDAHVEATLEEEMLDGTD